MTTTSSRLSKPLGMSVGSGTFAKKKNPEPPPPRAYGYTTIYGLIGEGKVRPIKITRRLLI